MRVRESPAEQAKASVRVAIPPSSSRLESVLAPAPAAWLLTLTDTAEAFRHLAAKERDRLIVMTSYLDAVGSV